MLGQRVHKEQLGRLEQMVTMVLQALKDPKETQVQRGTLDLKAQLVMLDQLEQLALKDLQETQDRKVLRATLGHKDRKVLRVQPDQHPIMLVR